MSKEFDEETKALFAVSVSDVHLAYRRLNGFFRSEFFWALEGVSFNLLKGETLGVIGKNGAGKSSLLRLIAGITTPDIGDVAIHNGLTATLLSLQAGFLPQLTGRENAVIAGMMLGLKKKTVLNLIEDIAAFADIGEFFDYPVKVYSSGMRARLGFSVAVHSNSDIILLDEVLGVGDADFKKKSSSKIRQQILNKKSVVLVSHNTQLINEVCDRVLWIENKKVKMIGKTHEVLEQFNNSNN